MILFGSLRVKIGIVPKQKNATEILVHKPEAGKECEHSYNEKSS